MLSQQDHEMCCLVPDPLLHVGSHFCRRGAADKTMLYDVHKDSALGHFTPSVVGCNLNVSLACHMKP